MTDQPLREADVDHDPLKQFSNWFDQAREAGLSQPEAMALATADTSGMPSVRMVLCKGYDERGFVFFTHYDSHKGADLHANPQAALLFYWEIFGRQVRIEGRVQPVTREETEAIPASSVDRVVEFGLLLVDAIDAYLVSRPAPEGAASGGDKAAEGAAEGHRATPA